ncbi:molybdate ABC transporter substrate-binding protein [Marinobacter halodurans]|uniref:Molybdate ABC transporter substrate-binding protein n=1 Tax=Marinobacter halodurans TaxID=2528979 RepID=A0ABY1ZH59_9GAMM|nr:molybdate ABC transporter substrate-binding protein [Marinobacter halodurans]TBW51866.1 molybdate ABC transporter substrate-binding protein [Marinobacter halodurans]
MFVRALLLFLASLFLATPTLAATSISVYAAASLTDAMDAVASAYEAKHDVDIVPVYASSSTLARQIANGAPADLYVSANEKWMDWLGKQGIELNERGDLLQNRLALIAPQDSPVDNFTPGTGKPIVSLLQKGERIATGDPAHVPAGIYAEQALQSLGEWHELQDRLARADNVRAALALVERGETPVGIVYQTDAKASQAVRQLGLFPEDSHKTITYPAALIVPARSSALNDFRQWLAGPEAMAIFQRFGFSPAPAKDH